MNSISNLKSQRPSKLLLLIITQISIAILCIVCMNSSSALIQSLGVISIGLPLMAFSLLGHEAMHNNISTSKSINDLIGQAFILPLFFPMETSRNIHLRHHAHLGNRNSDTTWRLWRDDELEQLPGIYKFFYDLSRNGFYGIGIFFYLVRLHFKTSELSKTYQTKAKIEISLVIMYFATIIAISILFPKFGFFYLTSWISFSFWFGAFSFYQHNDTAYDSSRWSYEDPKGLNDIITRSKSVNMGPLLNYLTLNMMLHKEHHAYPSVPFYNLSKVNIKEITC